MADRIYRTKLGDTWDVISLRVYGSELFVAELVAANWEHRAVALFSAGLVLRVPVIAAERRENPGLPPWRRRQ